MYAWNRMGPVECFKHNFFIKYLKLCIEMQRAADKNQTLFVPEFLNFRCSQEAMSFEQQKKQPSHFHKVGCCFWPLAKDQKMVPSSFGTVTWFFGTQTVPPDRPQKQITVPHIPPSQMSHYITSHNTPLCAICNLADCWGSLLHFYSSLPPMHHSFLVNKRAVPWRKGGGGRNQLFAVLCTVYYRGWAI